MILMLSDISSTNTNKSQQNTGMSLHGFKQKQSQMSKLTEQCIFLPFSATCSHNPLSMKYDSSKFLTGEQ